jgi:hypothetical protein
MKETTKINLRNYAMSDQAKQNDADSKSHTNDGLGVDRLMKEATLMRRIKLKRHDYEDYGTIVVGVIVTLTKQYVGVVLEDERLEKAFKWDRVLALL